MHRAIVLAILASMTTAGCAHMSTTEQRTLSGAGIGAVGGAAIAAATGGKVATGAVVGGVAGAAAGYLIDKSHR